jgi:hypothetical protein
MGEYAVCGRDVDRLCECSECGRLVYGLCFVDAVGLCRD